MIKVSIQNNLKYIYSDSNYKLKQLETGIIYGCRVIDALDEDQIRVRGYFYTYEETDILDEEVEVKDEEEIQ